MKKGNCMSSDSKDLTVEQVAEELQVHPRSVYKWIQTGELPAINLGSGGKHIYRISRVDLDAFKQARKTRRIDED
jgi:excisionase family DNA binding protein